MFIASVDLEEVSSPNGRSDEENRPGQYITTLGTAIYEETESYRKKIIQLEQDFLENPRYLLSSLLLDIRPYQYIFEVLCGIIDEVCAMYTFCYLGLYTIFMTCLVCLLFWIIFFFLNAKSLVLCWLIICLLILNSKQMFCLLNWIIFVGGLIFLRFLLLYNAFQVETRKLHGCAILDCLYKASVFAVGEAQDALERFLIWLFLLAILVASFFN